jgi:hypothetical protein
MCRRLAQKTKKPASLEGGVHLQTSLAKIWGVRMKCRASLYIHSKRGSKFTILYSNTYTKCRLIFNDMKLLQIMFCAAVIMTKVMSNIWHYVKYWT